MKTIHLLTAVCLGVIASPVFAQEGQQPEKPNTQMKSSMSMPMHGEKDDDEKDCEMMSMMKSEKKKGRMQMKQEHMQTMENHLANIEELLKQLVELQKQKGSAQ